MSQWDTVNVLRDAGDWLRWTEIRQRGRFNAGDSMGLRKLLERGVVEKRAEGRGANRVVYYRVRER